MGDRLWRFKAQETEGRKAIPEEWRRRTSMRPAQGEILDIPWTDYFIRVHIFLKLCLPPSMRAAAGLKRRHYQRCNMATVRDAIGAVQEQRDARSVTELI